MIILAIRSQYRFSLFVKQSDMGIIMVPNFFHSDFKLNARKQLKLQSSQRKDKKHETL